MASLCCCCFSGENDEDERQPLLQPPTSTKPNATESARQTWQPPTDTTGTATHSGRLELRRVGLPELDQRFSDAAETFNEQQGHYEAMERCVAHLCQSYGCNHDNTLLLSECVRKIRDEHGRHYRISLVMKGYDFSLSVVPLESDEGGDNGVNHDKRLRSAQDALRGMSQAAKMTVSAGTKLQELIGWLLRGEEGLVRQVAGAAPNHLERQRLEENLQASLREMRRGKALSLGYKQRAGDMLNAAARLAGVEL